MLNRKMSDEAYNKTNIRELSMRLTSAHNTGLKDITRKLRSQLTDKHNIRINLPSFYNSAV